MIYAAVMGALAGHGWSTVEDVARRAALPLEMVNTTLTILVGEGTAFVKVDASNTATGAVLVYSDTP